MVGVKQLSLVLVVGVAILGLGIGLGLSIVRPIEPASLRVATPLDVVPVEPRRFEDQRPVDVVVTPGTTAQLKTMRAGIVTRLDVAPGDQLRSGDAVAVIDDALVVALATRTPPWRDLVMGNTGPDVVALQEELLRLGHKLTATGQLDRETLAAVGDLWGDVEVPTKVPLGSWIWLNSSSVTIASVAAALGGSVEAGSDLAAAETAPPSASVQAPTESVPGRRVLLVDGERLSMADSQTLDSAQLTRLKGTMAFRTALEQQSSGSARVVLKGAWILETPIEVYGVPPAALVKGVAGKWCVSTTAGMVPVEIVASQLGLSLVTSETAITDARAIHNEGETCP